MKAEKFKAKAQNLIDKLETLIETMPYQGDSCEASQKVCLREALWGFQKNVNGVENSDFKTLK